MFRTQIQLPESQIKRLRALANRQDVSVAELVRQSVDAFLLRHVETSADELRERALRVGGRFHSKKADVASRHDVYLAEDLAK